MAHLTDEIRAFIVNGLACFDAPATIIKAVDEQFKVKIDRFQVREYKPDSCKRPAKRWCLMHEEIRKAFIEQQAGIAIANKAVRLRRLERMADRAEAAGEDELAVQILEQAAKECGDAYTNKLKLTGAGGGPIQFQRIDTGVPRPPDA